MLCSLNVCLIQNGVSVIGVTATRCLCTLYQKSRWLIISFTMPRLNMKNYHAKYLCGDCVFLPFFPCLRRKRKTVFSPRRSFLFAQAGVMPAGVWCGWQLGQGSTLALMLYVVEGSDGWELLLNYTLLRSLCHWWGCSFERGKETGTS